MRLSLASVLFPSLAASLAVFASPSVANADCAAPQSYTKQLNQNEVTICPTYPGASGPGCPATGGMIRVDTSSGAATKIPDLCGTDASADCYVDQCVPAGTYQYGYGKPYSCGASCGVDYFIEVTVPHVDGGACDGDVDAGVGTDAAAPWDGAVPVENGFGSNPNCQYQSGADSGADASSDASASVDSGGTTRSDGGNGVRDASDESPNAAGDNDGGGGCSVGSLEGTNQTVLMVHGFGLALGLVALSRRRKRK